MDSNPLRVLVVDDSAVMRLRIRDCLEAAGIQVAGQAASGAEALEKLESLKPDAVTLDVQMPGMDGLATLEAILAKRPTPVIMVSALTQAGATVTLDALDRGALDFIAKPAAGSRDYSCLETELPAKLRSAARVDMVRMLARRKQGAARVMPALGRSPLAAFEGELRGFCVALGISTGGPPALTQLFSDLKPPLPPIVIVQHMPAKFTPSFAKRLDTLSAIRVKEAASGDVLQPNQAYLAPGGLHLTINGRGNSHTLAVLEGTPVSGHMPSVDVMMQSAAKGYGARCLGVIMTGMGRDGADGCKAIRAAGGYVLGQNQATSDVYGMNQVAHEEGQVDRQFALQDGAQAITGAVERRIRAVLVHA